MNSQLLKGWIRRGGGRPWGVQVMLNRGHTSRGGLGIWRIRRVWKQWSSLRGAPTMSGFMSLPLFVIFASDYACIALQDWGSDGYEHNYITWVWAYHFFLMHFWTSSPYLGHSTNKNGSLPGHTLLPNCKAIALSYHYTILRSYSSLISDSTMELKDKDHSAPPAGAAGYPNRLGTSTGGSGGLIGSALPIEHTPTSFSMISTESSSIYTCSGIDKQGRRWEDDTFCTIPTSLLPLLLILNYLYM